MRLVRLPAPAGADGAPNRGARSAALGVVCVVTALLTASGCTRPNSDPVSIKSPAVSTDGSGTGGPSAVAPATARPSDPAVAHDGKTAVLIKALNLGAGTITVDPVTLILDPDAVNAYWHKWHPSESDGPPEGYVFENDSKKVSALTLTETASVKLINLDASDASVAQVASQADLAGQLQDDRYQDPTNGGSQFPFWMTTKNGQVVGLEEVYLA